MSPSAPYTLSLRRSLSGGTLVVARAPLRLPLGGGGTDLQSFYERSGGFFISAAIDKYLYVAVNRPKGDRDIWVKYSASEHVASTTDVQHDLVRHALTELGIADNIEIVSLADIQAGTGMGTSGSYVVALLSALLAVLRKPVSQGDLAELACRIEIDLAGHPVGKQDQYAAAYGGLNGYTVATDGRVSVENLPIPDQTVRDLEACLILYFTQRTRSSSNVLAGQRAATLESSPEIIASLEQTMAIGREARDSLIGGDLDRFGHTLREHWRVKKYRSAGVSFGFADELYEAGMKAGALGGKIVGAGGGGFMLFLCEPGRTGTVRDALRRYQLLEMPFHFDWEGAKVVADI